LKLFRVVFLVDRIRAGFVLPAGRSIAAAVDESLERRQRQDVGSCPLEGRGRQVEADKYGLQGSFGEIRVGNGPATKEHPAIHVRFVNHLPF